MMRSRWCITIRYHLGLIADQALVYLHISNSYWSVPKVLSSWRACTSNQNGNTMFWSALFKPWHKRTPCPHLQPSNLNTPWLHVLLRVLFLSVGKSESVGNLPCSSEDFHPYSLPKRPKQPEVPSPQYVAGIVQTTILDLTDVFIEHWCQRIVLSDLCFGYVWLAARWISKVKVSERGGGLKAINKGISQLPKE